MAGGDVQGDDFSEVRADTSADITCIGDVPIDGASQTIGAAEC